MIRPANSSHIGGGGVARDKDIYLPPVEYLGLAVPYTGQHCLFHLHPTVMPALVNPHLQQMGHAFRKANM